MNDINKATTRKRQAFNIPSNEKKWGLTYFLPFLFSVIALGFVSIFHKSTLSVWVTIPSYSWIKFIIIFVTFVFSISSLAIAHISYPRIHNLKILLLGYLIFSIHLFYIAIQIAININPSLLNSNTKYSVIIYILVALSMCFVFSVKSFTKFQLVKTVLASSVTFMTMVLIYSFLGFLGELPIPELKFGSQGWLLPLFATIGVTFLSFKLIPNEYNFGGAISGILWLYALSASVKLTSIPQEQALLLENISIFLASGFILITLVSNWLMRMSHRLYYDPLTQIYNREYCDAILEERSNITMSKPSSIAMFDIDKFKNFNDTYGHATGDRVLQHVAQQVSRTVVPYGTACRYGGEEIIVFFPGLTVKEAFEICSNVNKNVKEGWIKSGRRKVRVTISGGVAELTTGISSLKQVLKSADKALYKAKDNGRDRIEISRKRALN